METTISKVQVGWSAYDEVGDKLGEVAGVGRNYVLIQKGLILPTDLYIPASRIDSLDARDSAVTVAVLKQDVETLGWESPPTDSPNAASDTATVDSVTVPYRS